MSLLTDYVSDIKTRLKVNIGLFYTEITYEVSATLLGEGFMWAGALERIIHPVTTWHVTRMSTDELGAGLADLSSGGQWII